MLILAIDTSARHFSLALLDEQIPIAQFDSRDSDGTGGGAQRGSSAIDAGSPPQGVSATLFPAIRDLFAKTKFGLGDVEAVVVAVGPGMFTGLRVGVVTAKTLAYAQQIPVLGVNTLEVIAAQTAIALDDGEQVIRPAINAQRQQLFCGAYRNAQPWRLEEISPNEILDRDAWLASLNDNVVVTGAGLRPLSLELQEQVARERKIEIADESTWDCSALGVGLVGREYLSQGKSDDLWKLEPYYFRPSAAEEKLLANPQTSSQD